MNRSTMAALREAATEAENTAIPLLAGDDDSLSTWEVKQLLSYATRLNDLANLMRNCANRGEKREWMAVR